MATRRDLGDMALQVEFDGRTYVLRPGDFTGADDLAVHRKVGMSITEVFAGNITLFAMAALIWRYRINNGEPEVTFEDVNDKMTFADLATIDEASEGDETPEA